MAKGIKTGGRKPGSVNKTTAVFKDALTAVYAQLQADHDADVPHSHFLKWAKDNDTEFYKLAAKLIPIQINGSGEDGEIIHTIRLVGVSPQ